MTASYVFVLGRTPHLSLAELSALHPEPSFHEVVPGIVDAKIDNIDPVSEIARLGGTVKIATPCGEYSQISPDVLAEIIIRNLPDISFTFGVSTIGPVQIGKSFLAETKERLEAAGRHVRFVEGKHGNVLSSAVIVGQHLSEFIVVKKDTMYVVSQTVAVQNIDRMLMPSVACCLRKSHGWSSTLPSGLVRGAKSCSIRFVAWERFWRKVI